MVLVSVPPINWFLLHGHFKDLPGSLASKSETNQFFGVSIVMGVPQNGWFPKGNQIDDKWGYPEF